jgi:hypothetical protein
MYLMQIPCGWIPEFSGDIEDGGNAAKVRGGSDEPKVQVVDYAIVNS